jgi:hypothetical protein
LAALIDLGILGGSGMGVGLGNYADFGGALIMDVLFVDQ